VDGGWICGSNCLKKAKEMIEKGLISSAIVGVTNLTLQPEIQFLHQGLNKLTKSDKTKSFSSDGKYIFLNVYINIIISVGHSICTLT